LPPIDIEDNPLQVELEQDADHDDTDSTPQYVSMQLPENDG